MYNLEFTGFGRPLGDDCTMGICPRFSYTTTMAEEKTEYLRNLEMLMETYKACYGYCIGDRTINKLSLLFVMFESGEMFGEVAKKLESEFIIDIDRDVDYQKWGKLETWTEQKAKKAVSPSTLNYDSLKMAKDSTFANNMTSMLPPVPQTATDEKKSDEWVGLTYTERDKFKATINNLINKDVFNDHVLDYAIGKALETLCTALLRIDKAIKGKKNKEIYGKLYDGQPFAYSIAIGKSVNDEHERWKDSFFEDKISEVSLKKRVEHALIQLLETGIFGSVTVNAPQNPKAKYIREIDFGERNEIEKTKLYDQYACLRKIYSYQDEVYAIDKEQAGRFLYKIRKDADKVKAFFIFDQTLKLVYNDMRKLKETDMVNSVIDDIDFRTLECRFSEDEVKQAGINHAQAPTVLALMDKMAAGRPKAYWLCFYCVLLEKGWIEDNVAGFCKRMGALFKIRLDHSQFCKATRESGTDVESWPENDERNRVKRAFGVQFKAYIDFYLDYKRQLICAGLE